MIYFRRLLPPFAETYSIRPIKSQSWFLLADCYLIYLLTPAPGISFLPVCTDNIAPRSRILQCNAFAIKNMSMKF
jgi:hypothetical protein